MLSGSQWPSRVLCFAFYDIVSFSVHRQTLFAYRLFVFGESIRDLREPLVKIGHRQNMAIRTLSLMHKIVILVFENDDHQCKQCGHWPVTQLGENLLKLNHLSSCFVSTI